MVDIFAWVQMGALITTALSALGLIKYVRDILHSIETHDRILFGEDAVDEWNGLIELARRNRDLSEHNHDLISKYHDHEPTYGENND